MSPRGAARARRAPSTTRCIAARPHPGQIASARHLRALLAGSEIAESHRDCGKVQDAYSLRCMPQVHGAARDVLGSCARRARARDQRRRPTTRSSSPTTASEVISGGNFHGQPVALALDFAAIAVAELAYISRAAHRAAGQPAPVSGLPPFLAPSRPGSTPAS